MDEEKQRNEGNLIFLKKKDSETVKMCPLKSSAEKSTLVFLQLKCVMTSLTAEQRTVEINLRQTLVGSMLRSDFKCFWGLTGFTESINEHL